MLSRSLGLAAQATPHRQSRGQLNSQHTASLFSITKTSARVKVDIAFHRLPRSTRIIRDEDFQVLLAMGDFSSCTVARSLLLPNLLSTTFRRPGRTITIRTLMKRSRVVDGSFLDVLRGFEILGGTGFCSSRASTTSLMHFMIAFSSWEG